MKGSLQRLSVSRTSILAAAPWVLCLLAFSRPRVALFFLVTCIVLTFAGLALLTVLVPSLRLDSWVLLALPVGLLEASFASALAARFGIDLVIPALFLLLMCLLGAWVLLGRRAEIVALTRSVLPGGLLAVLLSAAICAVHFVPVVLWDGTYRPDGSFGWHCMDAQHWMAMTTSILRGGAPPDMPGLAGAPLWYHYGRFAVAAMVHKVTLCSVADSLFRIVGGVGKISLALSALALGRVLGALRGRRGPAGLLAVFGLFFVGWLSWPLSALAAAGELPVRIVGLPPQYLGQLLFYSDAASLLWGSVGLFVVLSVLLESTSSGDRDRVKRTLPFLATLLVPMNGMAALAAAGVCWIELGYCYRRRLSYLVVICLSIAVTALSLWVFMNPLRLVGNTFSFDTDPRPEFFLLFMVCFLGLGTLLLGLGWLQSFPQTAVSRVLMILIVGFFPIFIFLENRDWNDFYGVMFPTVIIIVFAMARLGTWIGDGWLSIARRTLRELGTAIAATAGLFMVLGLAIIVSFGPGSRRLAALPAGAAAAALGGLVLVWSSHKRRAVVAAGGAIVALLFLIQSMAWVPILLQAIRNTRGVSISSGEVKGLLQLRELSRTNSLCVTNHHGIPGVLFRPARSYMYTAISERAFVLEGWRYREMDAPGFQEGRRFSEQVFATRNPEVLCRILNQGGVDFVVARPGTDLHVSAAECGCIVKIPDCGSLRVYRVRSLAPPAE